MLNKKGGLDFSIEGIFKLVLFMLALFLIIVVLPNFLIFWKGIVAVQKIDNLAADISSFHHSSYAAGLPPQNKQYNFPNTVSEVYIGMSKDDGTTSVCAIFYQDKLPRGDYCAPISSDSATIMLGKIEDGSWTCDPAMVGISLAMWFVPISWVAKPVIVGAKFIGKILHISVITKSASVVARGGSAVIGKLTPKFIKGGATSAVGKVPATQKLINEIIINKYIISGLKSNIAKAEAKGLHYFKQGRELKTITNSKVFTEIVKGREGARLEGNEGNTLHISLEGGGGREVFYNLNKPTTFVKGMEALGIQLRGDALLGKGLYGKAINGYTVKGGKKELLFRIEDRGFREAGIFKHEGVLLTGKDLHPYKLRKVLLPGYGAGGVVRMGVGSELYKYAAYDCGTVVNLSFHSCNVEVSGEKLQADIVKFQSDFDIFNTIVSAVSGCEPPKKAITHDACAAGYSAYMAHQNVFIEQNFEKNLDSAIGKDEDCKKYVSMLLDPMAYNINCYCSDDYIAQVELSEKKYACKGVLNTEEEGMDCVNIETNELFGGNCINTTEINLADCIKNPESDYCKLSVSCNLIKQTGKDVKFEDRAKLLNIKKKDGDFYCDYTTDGGIVRKLLKLYGGTGSGKTGTGRPYVEINCKETNEDELVVKKIAINKKEEVKDGTVDKKVFVLYNKDTAGVEIFTDLTTTIIIKWDCEGIGDNQKCYTCVLAGDDVSSNHFENYTAIKTYIAGDEKGLPGRIEQKYLCTANKETEKSAKEKYNFTYSVSTIEPPTLAKVDCVDSVSCQTVTFKRWDTGNLENPQAGSISYSNANTAFSNLTGSGTISISAPFVNNPSTAIECDIGGKYCEEGGGEEEGDGEEEGYCAGLDVTINPCSGGFDECKKKIFKVMNQSQNLASQNYVVVKVDEVKQQQAIIGTPCSTEGL